MWCFVISEAFHFSNRHMRIRHGNLRHGFRSEVWSWRQWKVLSHSRYTLLQGKSSLAPGFHEFACRNATVALLPPVHSQEWHITVQLLMKGQTHLRFLQLTPKEAELLRKTAAQKLFVQVCGCLTHALDPALPDYRITKGDHHVLLSSRA